MIDVRNLSKTFYVHRKDPGFWGSVRSLVWRKKIAREAVRGVTFRVDQGEILGLVGANGAGKTTIVKMLAGIVHPSGGEVRVLGFDPWERDNRFRSQIALIMGQKAQLWWDLPAGDCFLLLREIYRIPETRYRETLDQLSHILGVEDLLDIQIRRLSLGERMKMELIAALLHNPRVVYFDEPTIGLDLSAQRAIREFVLQYQTEFQPAVILTSHYMEDIERLCRRIIILRQGEIVYDGSIQEVVRRYATHKIITAHLQEGSPIPENGDGLGRFGEVLEQSSGAVRLQVPREKVASAAAGLISCLPVSDLNIEEEGIGSIISNIMMGREDSAE